MNKKMLMPKKETIAGYMFILPFLIGFFAFFVPMLIKSVIYSFSNMTVESGGYVLSGAASNGFEHYIRALFIDPDYNRDLLKAVKDMFLNVPLVLIFSFFAANLLNQKFRGRGIARSIFFFPVILTSGILMSIEASDLLISTLGPENALSADDANTVFNVSRFLIEYTGLPTALVMYLSKSVLGIYDIVVASGVQILIFLAGLQGISPSLFEASNMEGATAWENFWKITFPMISPLILVNSIYTIIDSFTSAGNELMTVIKRTIFTDVKFGYGSAMAWIYFLVIAVLISSISVVVARKVFYMD
ncbi:carbohydrate ABC transporter permease [Butyrivibrio sp. MC2013]|uniref:carbohydrate ABC transporter permease n=1 Tax=Butyrivibrio sp. MC2013 TaxID=1280686 RepID=UPI00040CC69E|nr:sugar ABC transporter permease [Butyrivibrio sp. MC2013]